MKKIVFIDGCDYVGKTTLLNEIEKLYLQKDIKVKRLRFPSDKLRETIAVKFNGDYHAASSELYKEDILTSVEEALKGEEELILCDRSLFTSLVYQEQDDYLMSLWYSVTILIKLMKSANIHHLFVDESQNEIVRRFKESNKGEDTMDKLSLKDFKVKIKEVRSKYQDIAKTLKLMKCPNVVSTRRCDINSWYKLGIH